MFYTIGQVAKMFNISISAIRFYDKEGLLSNIDRVSGIRKFSDKNLEVIRVIECLKKSRLKIKDIKKFMQWCALGSETYSQCLELFETQKTKILEELDQLKKTLAMIKFKCWYYSKAIEYTNETLLNELIPNDLPKDIKALYDECHKNLKQ